MGLHRMAGLRRAGADRAAVGRAVVGLRIRILNDTKTPFLVEKGEKFAARQAPSGSFDCARR
jgi:hypothetical protein